jgi:hypothetical protein
MVLLLRAHSRLTPTPWQEAEEPEITGELVRLAQDLIESDEAELWMEHLEVMDDPPQNVVGRLGKRRPRIDIEFVQTGRGRRPRFHIEAKRLYRSDSVNEYLGSSGLGMFVDGVYAAEWPSAGMLGYVQSESCIAWISRLERAFNTRLVELHVCEGSSQWESAGWSGPGLDEVKSSCHDRSHKGLGRIAIHHLLMAFC